MIRVDDAAWLKRRMVHVLPRRGPARGAPPPRAPMPALLGDRAALPARPAARLRAPARQPGHGQDPRGLHRGRGDRAGALRVLPLARRQREAALRHDRVERADLHPAGRRRQARHGGPAAARRRAADQRDRRGDVPEPGRLRRLLQEPGGHPGDSRRRLGHSGDAGFFDKDGHLKIIDRARDVGRLPAGTIFAPKYLENKLKFSPYVKEAVCVGHERGLRERADQHRPGLGRQLGGAPRPRLHELHRSGPEARGLRADPTRGGAGQPEPPRRGDAVRGPDPALPAPAQGAGRGRPGDHPHPQGAARLRGREVRPADRGPLRRPRTTSTWRPR